MKAPTQNMVTHALQYANRFGFSIVPVCSPRLRSAGCLEHGPRCASPGKVPLVNWRQYQTERPAPEQLRAWWEQWPDANIGLITGQLSGVVALDLDSQQALNEVETRGYQHGPWATTGRVGGRHLFFAWDESAPRNFVKQAGIDFRGEGGLLILPPSRHASGTYYQWQQELDEHVVSGATASILPSLPAWVGELVAQRETSSATSADWRQNIWEGVPEGERNTTLFLEAAKLRGAGVRHDVASNVISILARRCQPPLDEQEAQSLVDSAYTRYQPNPPDPPRLRVNGKDAETAQLKAARVQSTRVTDVEPEVVSWLWPGRIPLGKLTVLDGDPDLGKSLVTLDIAARISRDMPMPDGSRSDLGEPAGVLLLSAEDGLADTVVPRLLAAGADGNRIIVAGDVEEPNGKTRSIDLPADLPLLAPLVVENGIRLIVVDVLMAYLGENVNTKQDHDVRRALAPLARFAEEHDLAIVAIRHLNKANTPNPLYRGGASIGITGAARSVLMVGADPDDPEESRRILARVKCNLAAPVPSLAYHLEAAGDTVVIVWEGPSSTNARDLVNSNFELPEERAERTEAQAFLKSALANGPKSASDIEQAARDAGISPKRLRTARGKLGVHTEKTDFRGGWLWSLGRLFTHGLHQDAQSTQNAQDAEDAGGVSQDDFVVGPETTVGTPNVTGRYTPHLGQDGQDGTNGHLGPETVCEGCGHPGSPQRGQLRVITGHLLHDQCRLVPVGSETKTPWWAE